MGLQAVVNGAASSGTRSGHLDGVVRRLLGRAAFGVLAEQRG